MSTGFELVPLALAAGAVLGRRRAGSAIAGIASAQRARQMATPQVLAMETRCRDARVICEALGDTATITQGVVHGSLSGLPVAFAPDADGVHLAYFHGDVEHRKAQGALRAFDMEYARIVQRKVRTRILERAGDSGLTVTDEQLEHDGTVVLTLQVGG